MLFNNSHIRTKLIQHTTFFPIVQAFLSISQKKYFLDCFLSPFSVLQTQKKGAGARPNAVFS